MTVPRRDGSAIKRERMRQMRSMLSGGEKMDYTKFLAMVSYTIGLSHETTEKYLKDLKALGLIEVDKGKEWLREVVKE